MDSMNDEAMANSNKDSREEEESLSSDDDASAAADSLTSASLFETGEAKDSQTAESAAESKRKKRLELNRKAAKESRERKKKRVEALNNNIVMLTRENYELRTHNEELRELVATGGVDDPEMMDQFQADNAILRLAVYECVENLVHSRFPNSAALFLAPGVAEPKQSASSLAGDGQDKKETFPMSDMSVDQPEAFNSPVRGLHQE